jgi:predicted aldo/keto reductase-like oxidoreductase
MPDRRSFLRTLAASAATSQLLRGEQKSDKLGPMLPTRPLGATGESVTAFTVGGFHVAKAESEKEAQKLIEHSLESGVRCFDNARQYSGGLAEKQYGRYLTPKFREHIYLTTKTTQTSGKEARAELEQSLKAMKVEQLDLWQIHGIHSPDDIDQRIENGVLDEFLKAREEGKTRHLGFTGHTSYKAHLHMLKRLRERGLKLDTCLMPMNLVDPHYDSFITHVLPELEKDNYAIFAMKTMAFGRMLGAGPAGLIESHGKTQSLQEVGIGPQEMHHYAYSLPICSLVSGCESAAQLEENIAFLRNYKGLDNETRDQLLAKAKPFAGTVMEHYKA